MQMTEVEETSQVSTDLYYVLIMINTQVRSCSLRYSE